MTRAELVARADALSRQGTPGDRIGKPALLPSTLDIILGEPCTPAKRSALGKVHQAVSIWRSGHVLDAIAEGRTGICKRCPHATRVRRKAEPEKTLLFCRCCGCARWSFGGEGSDLASKNQFAGHVCPLGKFGPVSTSRKGRKIPLWKIPILLGAAWFGSRD
jgi:hypothetical protein